MTSKNTGSNSVPDICTRIKHMGYAASKRVKLYGEEFEIVSDPILEGRGIAVQARTKKNPSVRMVRLPSTVLQGVLGRKSPSAA